MEKRLDTKDTERNADTVNDPPSYIKMLIFNSYCALAVGFF